MKIATVSESAFQILKAKIITGEIRPGIKLDESRVSEWLDISRPPIREAFRRLESEHMVYTIPRKGAFVSDISVEDFIELYQVRCMAELCAVEILEEKDIREFVGLEAALEDVEEYSIPPDATPAQELNLVVKIQDFHVMIVEAAGNKRLSSFYETINSNVCRYTYIYRSVSDTVKTWTIEHRQIAAFLKEGNFGEAKKLITVHINAYRKESFLRLLEDEIIRRREGPETKIDDAI
ncbi:MAG TPA: GntR family transcriptional regulator [Spirochaetota bacterium]|nr:GntR family transcriptional regulator [Spirochaetota bacterium]